MSFRVAPFNERSVVVRVGEELDVRNAEEFKETWREHLKEGTRHFILDFSETDFIDSTGLGAIFSLYRRLSSIGGKVAFASVSRPVLMVVNLTRCHRVFDQYRSVEAAKKAMD